MDCDLCIHYEFDEDDGEYYCTADMDEDDYAMLMQEHPGKAACPYWQSDDEYAVVAHQAFAHGPNPDPEDARAAAGRRYHKASPGPEYGGSRPDADSQSNAL